MTINQNLVNRYLKILNVRKSKPCMHSLTELVKAHITCVPFENISKIYYNKKLGLNSLIGLPLYLDGIEKYNFGGTCYSNNYFFNLLLKQLGYKVKLCGADMNNPNVHMVSIVEIEGREYIIDAGYAAPFLKPLPRDLNENYEILMTEDRYVLKPQDSIGCSQLLLFRKGKLKHGYLVKPEAKRITDFTEVIAQSFRPDATFLNSILLTRFYPNRSIRIHNFTFIDIHGTKTRTYNIPNREELSNVINAHFGIPKNILNDTLIDLGELRDSWA